MLYEILSQHREPRVKLPQTADHFLLSSLSALYHPLAWNICSIFMGWVVKSSKDGLAAFLLTWHLDSLSASSWLRSAYIPETSNFNADRK